MFSGWVGYNKDISFDIFNYNKKELKKDKLYCFSNNAKLGFRKEAYVFLGLHNFVFAINNKKHGEKDFRYIFEVELLSESEFSTISKDLGLISASKVNLTKRMLVNSNKMQNEFFKSLAKKDLIDIIAMITDFKSDKQVNRLLNLIIDDHHSKKIKFDIFKRYFTNNYPPSRKTLSFRSGI